MTGKRRYTDEQLAFVSYLSKRGHTDRQVAALFNERYGTSKTPEAMQGVRRAYGIPSSGRVTCDRWGNPVRLRPGEEPLLSERVAPGGYIRVKVGYFKSRYPGDMWIPRAQLVWEREHGRALPEGMRVVHADGDRTNDDPGNLVAMTVPEFAMIHGSRWEYGTREELEALVDMARILLRANELEGKLVPDVARQRRLERARRNNGRA